MYARRVNHSVQKRIQLNKNVSLDEFHEFLVQEVKDTRSLMYIVEICCRTSNIVCLRRVIQFLDNQHSKDPQFGYLELHQAIYACLSAMRPDLLDVILSEWSHGIPREFFERDNCASSLLWRYSALTPTQMNVLCSHGLPITSDSVRFLCGLPERDTLTSLFIGGNSWLDVHSAILDGLGGQCLPSDLDELICSFVLSYSHDGLFSDRRSVTTIKHKEAVVDSFLRKRKGVVNSAYWVDRALSDGELVKRLSFHDVVSLFRRAINQRHWNAAARLLPRIDDLDKTLMSPWDAHLQRSILHEAVKLHQHFFVKCLLARGVNVSSRDIVGVTPLLVACGVCDIEMVKILLKYGASLDDENEWGTTPLIAVCSSPRNFRDSKDVLPLVKFLCETYKNSASKEKYVSWLSCRSEDPRLWSEKGRAMNCAESRGRGKTASYLREQEGRGDAK